MPGTGMCEPKRYRARSAAVKASFLRISPTVKALRIVDSIGRLRLLDGRAGAAGSLDGCAGGGAELVRVNRQRLGDLALGEDLDRDVLAGAQALVAHGLVRLLFAWVEARLEVLHVDRLRVRAERLEGHRHLLRRPAQLAHPHVDRHLAALEARTVLRARARPRALLAAAGGLAR